ncbi:MAG: hypothetical protein EOO74_11120 [Myxococcales bacterium]|nr:MAG: hypothetical protein EOO74_11120 [Myxococcales bacterium]
MAHRPLSWLLSLAAAALLSGCIESTETFAIRNDTATPLAAAIDLQGEFHAYDCATNGTTETAVSEPTTLTIAPGRRLCLRGSNNNGIDAVDAVRKLTISRGEVVCVEGDSDSLRTRFEAEQPLPTLNVRETDCN